ncbi:MAG: TetR/AcrR family transcriptional regulator [Chloroflexota bacterium]|jgi:AcrR family transcriptional regulator
MVATERKVYQLHRDRQRESILEAAEGLFLAHGIDDVNMADIALAAQVTRATLYKYFPNKQEIAWAVFENYCELMTAMVPDECILHTANGLTRVAKILEAWCEFFHTYPQRALYFAQFDVLYAKDGSTDRMNRFKYRLHQGDEPIVLALRAGMADGSIRADITPELMGVTIMTVIAGIERRLAVSMPTFEGEFGYTSERVYHMTCALILQGLKSSE